MSKPAISSPSVPSFEIVYLKRGWDTSIMRLLGSSNGKPGSVARVADEGDLAFVRYRSLVPAGLP
jgi:hypothetical protein